MLKEFNPYDLWYNPHLVADAEAHYREKHSEQFPSGGQVRLDGTLWAYEGNVADITFNFSTPLLTRGVCSTLINHTQEFCVESVKRPPPFAATEQRSRFLHARNLHRILFQTMLKANWQYLPASNDLHKASDSLGTSQDKGDKLILLSPFLSKHRLVIPLSHRKIQTTTYCIHTNIHSYISSPAPRWLSLSSRCFFTCLLSGHYCFLLR